MNKKNISDYRPAMIEEGLHGDDEIVDHFKCMCVPNTVSIWLENGDVVWYHVRSERYKEM